MTTLTPVQQEALRRAQGKPGYAWFLDMGLGKTLAALAEFDDAIRNGKVVSRMAVICPNSFKSGWRDEIEKHGFGFDVHIYEAAKHKAAEAFVARGQKGTPQPFTKPPVLVINYEAARLDKVLDLLAEFAAFRPTVLILDESIAIKNHSAKRTKAILSIAPIFRRIRLLTGRPLTQGPHDLWAQLKLIGAHPFNYWSFRNRYCRMGGWQGKQVIGAINADELQERMAPLSFQAKKQDWLVGMPTKAYTTRDYDLGPVLGPKYREMEILFQTWLADQKAKQERPVTATIVLTQLQKLQQIMCGFAHTQDGEAHALVPSNENPRLQLLLEILEESAGKVAIAFVHRFVGDQLTRVLTLEGYGPAVLRGGLKGHEIDAEKRRFNSDPACRVILLQTQASKFGHTLLGDQADVVNACSTLVFYQHSYSLDDRSQIEDRIHRIGQKSQSCLYVDICGAAMDRMIIRALQHKQNVYDLVMGP